MKNGAIILTKKKSIIHEKLRKINTLESTTSSVRPNKLKLIKDVSSLMKFSENNNPKKIIDFPICLSLFTNNNSINDIDLKLKNKEINKLKVNLNMKSLKPKHLNNLNLNEIIKPKNKKIISRNVNVNYFNSLSPLSPKKISSVKRLFSPKRTNASELIEKKFDYSPSSNLITQKNLIIIKQKSLSPIVKLNSKINSLSENTFERDISFIKNIKKISINNLNYNINFNDKKIIPSILSSPLSSENIQKENMTENKHNKKKIYQLKKKVQKDINNFEHKVNKNNRDIINNKNKEINVNNLDNKNKKNSKNNNNDITIENKNNIEIFENRMKSNKNNTFYKESKKNINKYELDGKLNIRYRKRNSSNHFTYKLHNKLNKNIDKKSDKNNNKENQSDLDKNKLENQKEKENSIINKNKAKIDRLIRLKNTSIKNEVKDKNKVVIKSIKKEEIINIDKNKEKIENNRNEIVKARRKRTSVCGRFSVADNNSMFIDEDIKEDAKNKTFLTSKNLIKGNINVLTIRKNNFYLTVCKKETNDIFSKNKFLKNCNDIVNEKSSNNRVNRKIYVQKTKILLDMQDKLTHIINNEKTYLQNPEKIKIENINIFIDDILNKKIPKQIFENNKINTFIINYKYTCNMTLNLRNYLISSIDFSGFSDYLKSVTTKKKTLLIRNKNNKQPLKRKAFQTVKISDLTMLNNKFEKKFSEDFSLKKTKNSFYKDDNDWIYSPINLLSIQKIILRSNEYYFNYSKYDREEYRKKSAVKKLSKINSTDYSKRRTISSNKLFMKQLSLGGKYLKFSNLKKNLKKIPEKSNLDLSLLNQKKFFKRQKLKKISSKKFEKKNSNINDNSSDLSSSENNLNLEEIYLELLSHIIEGRNNQFFKLFEKNKRYIDINEKLIEGNTLLIISSREGNLNITKFLCSQGIKVNIQNDKGNTALHYAIGNQFYSIADILTSHGAREDIPNNNGLLPWDCVENNLE